MKKNKIYNEKTVHSFRELVSYCATNYGDRTAFTIKDSNKNLHDISLIEFENNIKELGSALLDLGLENKKIALISQDRYELCCSYFAISTSNNVVVPLDHLLPEVELQRLLIESKVDAIIFDKKYTIFAIFYRRWISPVITSATGDFFIEYCKFIMFYFKFRMNPNIYTAIIQLPNF